MNLKLVRVSAEYKDLIVEMLDEWVDYNNTHDENKSPAAIFKPYDNFNNYIDELNKIVPIEGHVPATTLFCLDKDKNKMVGAVDIRHYLNEFLLKFAGHIGDGVRPSERKKGYGTEILRLALIECKKLGLDRVLVVCSDDNIGSKKSIIKNGGVLESAIEHDGKIMERYWIDLES